MPTTRECLKGAFNGARRRSKVRGREFTIKFKDITDMWEKQGQKCALTGAYMFHANLGRSHYNAYAPSIDRIDSSRGYTPDNIQLVCLWANCGKGAGSDEDFHRRILNAARTSRLMLRNANK
jgi:hypothetical protein